MTTNTVRKITYMVNTLLFAMVLGLLGFFYSCGAKVLVYFSIPTICVYLFNYFLIYKNKLRFFIWLVYVWITIYMSLTTICLGFHLGFHLYCMSLIPVLFCSEYMGFKIHAKSVYPVRISIGIAIMYITTTVISLINGPIYAVDSKLAIIILICNCVVVFCFAIFYTRFLLNMVIVSEKELTKQAHVDKLTGLFNRHYMIEQLTKALEAKEKNRWIAMIDIDNFKKINDTYGHNAGDYVLMHISKLMKETCESCVVSRWGGEEFMIMAEDDKVENDLVETVRAKIAEKAVSFNGIEILVTISGGIAQIRNNQNLDEWISEADQKLYLAKEQGKNRIYSMTTY